MNREIKFRAWNIKEERMVESPYFFEVYHFSDENRINKFEYRYFEDWRELEDGIYHECVIMQFTGLKDKKGNEIYEGDIGEIKTQSGRIERFVVKWGIHRRDMKSGWTVDIPGFCFEVAGFPTFPIANNYLNGHDLDIITIIGNIYQNPELCPPTPQP